ncbi:hypothetical protein ACHAPT_004295 [Fusarium lateritium]
MTTLAIQPRSRAVPRTAKKPSTAKTRAKNRAPAEAIPRVQDSGANGGPDEPDWDNSRELVEIPDTQSELSTSGFIPRNVDLQDTTKSPSPGPAEQQAPGATVALRAEVLRLKGHNFVLQNRIFELEIDLKQISHCRESVNGNMEQLIQQMYAYEKRLAVMTDHLQHVADAETGMLGISEGDIIHRYKVLYNRIQGGSQSLCGAHDGPRITMTDQGDDSGRAWAIKTSSWELYPLLCHYNREAIPNSRLVVALVAAGIFDLVFERVFPEVLAVECPLMNGYRSHILAKDGPDALHMADLAALKSLTPGNGLGKERFEEEMVEEKAEHLTELMLQRLSFCIPPEKRQPPVDQDMEDDEAPDLKSPLRQALSLKLSLATSMARLKFYFFRPGSDFCKEGMERDEMSNPDGLVVKLCLLPALFSVPGDWIDTKFEKSRWGADAYYDRYFTEATEEEAVSLRLVAKAVVLT